MVGHWKWDGMMERWKWDEVGCRKKWYWKHREGEKVECVFVYWYGLEDLEHVYSIYTQTLDLVVLL